MRKKDREFVEIVKPKFSAVLSGTPQQVLNLIPDAENGLFSRFIFYTMPTELVWHDTFAYADGITADEQFKKIGLYFYECLKKLPKSPSSSRSAVPSSPSSTAFSSPPSFAMRNSLATKS